MKTYLRFDDNDLDESDLRNVMAELGETPESKRKSLLELRKRLKETKDLQPCVDENFLLRFLRVGKFDVDKAYDRLHTYYLCREKHPQIFSQFYPSSTVSSQAHGHIWLLPYRAPNNSVVVLHRRGIFNPADFKYEETVRLDALVMETILKSPTNQMCGSMLLVDMKGFCLQHLMLDTLSRLRMCSDIFQKSMPVRVKAIHVVNAPSIFSLLYKLAYPLFSHKLRDRLFIHSNHDQWKGLHCHLPPEILPEEYGGHLAKSDLISIVELANAQEDYFRSQLKYGFVRRKPSS